MGCANIWDSNTELQNAHSSAHSGWHWAERMIKKKKTNYKSKYGWKYPKFPNKILGMMIIKVHYPYMWPSMTKPRHNALTTDFELRPQLPTTTFGSSKFEVSSLCSHGDMSKSIPRSPVLKFPETVMKHCYVHCTQKSVCLPFIKIRGPSNECSSQRFDGKEHDKHF